ncbi:MAG: GTP 3',8-cyclase MoaA [candidate division Zixibacteria bacterium]|nr:GTP 3',8-cyclase MoaA [candidate division Zixibacteria bacterium]
MADNRLVDGFGRAHTYLRISVTDRCNLRCRYCMPADQVAWRASAELLTDDEIIHQAGLFASLGITKIRLTGGEPMVRPGIEHLIERLTSVPGIAVVAMTTNATLLRNKAQALKAAGLHGLNISLDTLRRDRFAAITGRDQLSDVMAGIDAAQEAGLAPPRINTVVMKNVNDDELVDFVGFAVDRSVCVRFIEFMPSQSATIPSAELLPFAEMKERIAMHFRLTPVKPAESPYSTVAKEYAIDNSGGRIGFITPMTDHFCDRCNRLRLTADGRLKTCLFYPAEISLRDAIRGGAGRDDLRDLVMTTLGGKAEYPPQADRVITTNELGMFTVGG